MSTPSDWLKNILPKIENAKAALANKKDIKKYQLDLIERIVKRLDTFSIDCSQCETHKQQISSIADQLASIKYAPKDQQKNLKKSIQYILKHLQKTHKLAKPGQYIGMGIGIGVAFGAAFNATLDNGAGIAIGLALGAAIGASQEAKAKKEGRMI